MIVADCAAVVDALTGLEGTDEVRDLLSRAEIHAPALLDYEVVSALRGLTRRRAISPARAEDALTDFGDLRVRRWPAADAFRRRAYQLRDQLTAYDAAYVVLAEALDCPLLTRDIRLVRSIGALVRVEVR